MPKCINTVLLTAFVCSFIIGCTPPVARQPMEPVGYDEPSSMLTQQYPEKQDKFRGPRTSGGQEANRRSLDFSR